MLCWEKSSTFCVQSIDIDPMCIWKQWKTPQNREKNLVKLGIDRNTARRVAYTGSRIAYVCNKGAVNVAISNKRLATFGLISMLDYYTERCVTC